MPLHLRALSFAASDPRRLAEFWSQVLRWEVRDEGSNTVDLVPTDGTRFIITFVPATGEAKVEKNRLHLDVTTTSRDDQAASVETLLALGARHIDIGQGADASHVVLADPEGNEFCIIEPENSFLAGCGRLGSITCDGSPQAGYFWSEALGWPLVWDQDEETAIRAPDGAGPFITWGPPVEPKVMRNRLHLDLAASSNDALSDEVNRLLGLGAIRDETVPEDGGAIAMLDPDGNEFRVVPPR